MSASTIKKSIIAIFITGILVCLNVDCTFAQTPSATTTSAPTSTYTAENPGWLVNLEEAYEISQKTGKPIMANFTGSDWCGWCKKLTASVFSKEEFKTWADKNVVLLELDFPRRKKLPAEIAQQNANLQQAFQIQGYPTVWVFRLNKEEGSNQYNIEALGKTGYMASVDEFISGIEQMINR